MKYTLISLLCVCALPLLSQQVRYDDEPCPQSEARAVSEEFSKSTVYQIFLRPFTRAGTLKAGEKLLEHVASLGVGIIQLCPVVLADDDANKDFWSGRQKAFGKNPKNPYRQKDYFKIDPEYGTPQDLKEFVAKAHSLGLKVVYDIVYPLRAKGGFNIGAPRFRKAQPRRHSKSRRLEISAARLRQPQAARIHA